MLSSILLANSLCFIHTTLSKEYAYTKVFSLPSEGAADILNILIIGRNKPIGAQPRHMAGFTENYLDQGHLINGQRSEGLLPIGSSSILTY